MSGIQANSSVNNHLHCETNRLAQALERDYSVSVIEQLLKKQELASKIVYMKPCWINRQTVPAKGEFPDWNTCAFFPGEIES